MTHSAQMIHKQYTNCTQLYSYTTMEIVSSQLRTATCLRYILSVENEYTLNKTYGRTDVQTYSHMPIA